jgi:hypothetical protein
MKISFSIHSNDGTTVRVNRLYQVTFLNVFERNLEVWSTILASQIGSDPNPATQLYLDAFATGNAGERLGCIVCDTPYSSDNNHLIPDKAWAALQKVWGKKSIKLLTTDNGDETRVRAHLEKIEGLPPFANEDSNRQYFSDCGLEFGALKTELLRIQREAGLAGLFADDARAAILPFQFGIMGQNFAKDGHTDNLDDGRGAQTTLKFGNLHQAYVPSLWIIRHKITLADRVPDFRSSGIELQFTAPAPNGSTKKGNVGEFRHYVVAPRLFELTQRSKLEARWVEINAESALASQRWDDVGDVIESDFNSLDKQQKSEDAYFPDWESDQAILERNYYKVNLPSSIGDYKSNWHRISLNITMQSIFREYALFMWGIVVPIIFAYGIDGDRLAHLEKLSKDIPWIAFISDPVSFLFQWTIVTIFILWLVVSWIFGSHLEREPELMHISSKSGGWRTVALLNYILWAIFTFGLSDGAMLWMVTAWNDYAFSVPYWLGFLIAPRVFGILALVASIISLKHHYAKHVGLFAAIRGLFPGLPRLSVAARLKTK